ncbi:MAG: GMP reductase [Planctomycetes bacterium]|nr:GMP reductase [Planctomycetota bacterium]
MRIETDLKLDFDDVLIRPKRSVAPSRASVDLRRPYRFRNADPAASWEGIPLLASNIDTIGTVAMAQALHHLNMLTCFHKFYPLDLLVDFFTRHPAAPSTFYTLGLRDEDLDKFKTFVDRTGRQARLICVDAANGYTKFFVDRVKLVRELCPWAVLLAGNVATPEMVQELLISGGADIVKVGIGPGSVCTTREMTGVGYPQLSAISECADAAHGNKGHICADGGCRKPGDVAKAFGAGADFVMLGGLLAGTDECEGDWVTVAGRKKSLKFYGMSSAEAQEKHHGGVKDYSAAEGKCVEVPSKGPVAQVLRDVTGGLRSACAYVGADRLKDFSKCCTFVRCTRTHNTVFESC